MGRPRPHSSLSDLKGVSLVPQDTVLQEDACSEVNREKAETRSERRQPLLDSVECCRDTPEGEGATVVKRGKVSTSASVELPTET